MKAERRHQLQQNSLARSLENLPKMGRESGSKLLLGIVAVLLIVVLVRFYLNNKEQKKEQVATQLANARVELSNLRGEGIRAERSEDVASLRNELFKKVDNAVEEVLSANPDAAQVAQARNIRGDADLQMATLTQTTEATTRPELASPRKPSELLDDASRNYQQVLDSRQGVPPTEIANALFGLAAVAENRGDWEKARSQYNAVLNDPGLPEPFHDLAETRRSLLDKINKPVLLGVPSSRPFEREAGSAPTTLPATGPAIPVAPSTAPAGPGAAPTTAPTTGPTTSPATTHPAGPSTAPIYSPFKL